MTQHLHGHVAVRDQHYDLATAERVELIAYVAQHRLMDSVGVHGRRLQVARPCARQGERERHVVHNRTAGGGWRDDGGGM